MAVWPGTLPVIPLLEGFKESVPDTSIRTQMDTGPARIRPRYTAGVRPIAGRISCDKTQVAALDAFYITTLLQGSQSFDWTHPRTGVSTTFRFTKPPTYEPVTKDRWTVTLDLEIMP